MDLAKCGKCGAKTFGVVAKCNDMCAIQMPGGEEYNGYVPGGMGIGCGDYIELNVCPQCAWLVGFWPIDLEELKAKLFPEEEDGDA